MWLSSMFWVDCSVKTLFLFLLLLFCFYLILGISCFILQLDYCLLTHLSCVYWWICFQTLFLSYSYGATVHNFHEIYCLEERKFDLPCNFDQINFTCIASESQWRSLRCSCNTNIAWPRAKKVKFKAKYKSYFELCFLLLIIF